LAEYTKNEAESVVVLFFTMALRISNLARYSSPLYVNVIRGSTASSIEKVVTSPLSFRAPQRQCVYKHATVALFSSSSSGAAESSSSSYSPIEWYRKRQERKEEQKYIDRIAFMAGKPNWTVGDMLAELDEGGKTQGCPRGRNDSGRNQHFNSTVSNHGYDASGVAKACG
jgi:hypothetical protein